jgi:hypothetical protein
MEARVVTHSLTWALWGTGDDPRVIRRAIAFQPWETLATRNEGESYTFV